MKGELQKSASGEGSKMLSAAQALDLLKESEEAGLFLVSVEVYELKDKVEIPRVDLSLYNVCNEVEIRHLPAEQKTQACILAFEELLELVKGNQANFGFRIWMED